MHSLAPFQKLTGDSCLRLHYVTVRECLSAPPPVCLFTTLATTPAPFSSMAFFEQIDDLDEQLRQEQESCRRLRSAVSVLKRKLHAAEEGRRRSNGLERAFFSHLAEAEALVLQRDRLMGPGANQHGRNKLLVVARPTPASSIIVLRVLLSLKRANENALHFAQASVFAPTYFPLLFLPPLPGNTETRAECIEAARNEAHERLALAIREELEENSAWR